MEGTFKTLMANRIVLGRILKKFDVSQLNKIPDGFNNNIIWNAAHIIAVNQQLWYGLSNNRYAVDPEIVKTFKGGTKPEKQHDEAFISMIETLLVQSMEKGISDYKAGLFVNFNGFETRIRTKIETIDDAVAFNLYHEGLHMGYVLSLMKFV